MSRLQSLGEILCPDLDSWRAWLQANHAQQSSIWLVRFRKGRGPALAYADARDEALCWGWIDSLPRARDADTTSLLMSPRRTGSAWSKINRERITALESDGRMQPAGREAVQRAMADGSWNLLAVTDDLAVPPDLALAIAALPPAAESFAAFPLSARRAMLEWLALAKRPETRARRIEAIAGAARDGRRAR